MYNVSRKECRESVTTLLEYEKEYKGSRWCMLTVLLTNCAGMEKKTLIKAFKSKIKWEKEQARLKRIEIEKET